MPDYKTVLSSQRWYVDSTQIKIDELVIAAAVSRGMRKMKSLSEQFCTLMYIYVIVYAILYRCSLVQYNIRQSGSTVCTYNN